MADAESKGGYLEVMNSGLPWRYRILAIGLFLALLAGVRWFTHELAYDWIPKPLIGYAAVGLLCLAIGVLIGERSAISRKAGERRDGDWLG